MHDKGCRELIFQFRGGIFSFFFFNLDQADGLANNRKSIPVPTATVSSHPCWKIRNLPGQYKHPLLSIFNCCRTNTFFHLKD